MLRLTLRTIFPLLLLLSSSILVVSFVGRYFSGDQLLYISLPDLDLRSGLHIHDLRHGFSVTVVDDLIGQGLDAAWSPDGRRIAYSVFAANEVRREIFILTLADGTRKRITPTDGDYNSPAWSPDGTRLAFHGNRGEATGWDIFVHDVATDTTQILYAGIGRDGRPTWSPDGQFIAFETTNSETGSAELLRLEIANRRTTQLTNSTNPDIEAAWSPDGQFIAFGSLVTLNFHLYRINADGTDFQPLIPSPGYGIFNPTWSPDGRRIAFSARRAEDDHYQHVYLVNLDHPEDIIRITSGERGYEQPHWRPK